MNGHERLSAAAGYFRARDLRERSRVSDMSIWRWLHNDELAFPKPSTDVDIG
jgi:hypothetical protein